MNYRTAPLLAILTLASAASFAQSITPVGTLGPLPAATFSGSGIDNTNVTSTVTSGITLGLTAHPRYDGPAVTNDGAGTYFVQPGASASIPAYASWNFGFYIDPTASTFGRGTTFKLFYDFNPASANDQSTHGSVSFPALTAVTQNSWNLGMPFLSTGAFGSAPTPTTFDQNALGEYTFALVAFDSLGAELARSAINVTAVPEPGTYALLLAGLAAVSFAARRKNVRA